MFRKPNSGKKSGNLSQFGLLDMDVDDADEAVELSDDDIDLEAELAAITGDGARRHRPRKPMPVPTANLDAMIAQSLQDVPSDDEGSVFVRAEAKEESSQATVLAPGDDDDPDLLDELQELAIEDDEAPPRPPRASRPAPAPPGSLSTESSTVSLLQDRILNYTAAEKNAKESGESSRARRFNRGLKTLNDLLKQAKAGRTVNDADIPPPVSLGKAAEPAPATVPDVVQPEVVQPEVEPEVVQPEVEPEPVPPQSPPQELSDEKSQGLQVILKRQQEFKAAALTYKHKGDKASALEFLKVVKQFDMVVDAYKSGQEMDLSELPTVEMIAASLKPEKVEEHVQKDADPVPAPGEGGLIMAATLEEALQQRMAEYKRQEAKAKEEGNASKARRLGRVAGQYAAALAAHKQGKPVPDLAALPVPLGYGPLPGSAAPIPHSATPATPASPATPATPATPVPQSPSRYDKQLAFLLHRQKEFKDAAIKAKKAGDIEQAKEYLRAAKGFDSVLDAARGGLKVDLASLPLPPAAKAKLEHTFDVVTAEDCSEASDESAISRLQHQLSSQLKLCIAHRDHYQAMGQIAEVNRFDHLAVKLQQDLDVVIVAKGLGKSPKFHYESRQFSIVQCNTDLNENDLELTIVRGITYNVPNPKEVDTYVKFEYPFPQEAPVIDRTHLVKDTNSPQYNSIFPLTIQRGARTTLRLFKRHGIKMEVYSRGGWFSSDKLLGTLTVKLAPLETQVTLHDTFPLMDGRRPAGGSLEVKVRVRSPILTQQLENTTHRWVVIDD